MDAISSKRNKLSVNLSQYKIFRNTLIFLIVFGLLFSGITKVYANDEKDAYNLASLSNTLANVFSLGMTPSDGSSSSGDDKDNPGSNSGVFGVSVLANSRLGNGGLVLGLTKSTTSVGQWIASIISGSSMAYDYIGLQLLPTCDDGTIKRSNSAYYYAVYGHLLKEVGLDCTTTNTTGNVHPLRFIAGGLLMVVWIVASLVYKLFDVALTILQAINPFFWLEGVAKKSPTVDQTTGLLQYYTTDASHVGSGNTIRNSLVSMVANLYVDLANLSWGLVIPLMLALYFFGVFVFKKTSGTKRLLIRLVFLSVGIPIMGGLYTGFLSDMKDLFTNQTTSCDQIILSTMVDFEGWAKYSHLNVNNNMKLSAEIANGNNNNSNAISGTASAETLLNLRDTCLAINQEANSAKNNSTAVSDYSKLKLKEANSKLNSKTSTYVFNMLSRYMKGDTYTADAFASYVQTSISKSEGNGGSNNGITGLSAVDQYHLLSAAVNLNSYAAINNDNSRFHNMVSAFTDYWNNEARLTDDDIKKSISGTTKASSIDTRYEQLASNGFRYNNKKTIFNDGGLHKDNPNSTSNNDYDSQVSGTVTFNSSSDYTFGLSTMSMYNYLNTDFNDDSVVVYGGGSAIASGLTSKQHYSVNIIGGSILMSLIYWFDAFILLSAIALIGLFYSLGMLSHALKNCLSIITTMPGAMLGSLRYMSKFIGIVVTMIANVLITAILYALCTNFLIGITQFIEGIISQGFSGFGLEKLVTVIGVSTFGRVVIQIIILIITFHLIKMRKSVVNEVTEFVQQVVGKFMEADAHPNPDKPKQSLKDKILPGIVSGASMAVGQGMAKGVKSAVGGALHGAVSGDKSSSDGSSGSNSGGPNGNGGPNGSGGDGSHDTVTGNTIEQENGDSYKNDETKNSQGGAIEQSTSAQNTSDEQQRTENNAQASDESSMRLSNINDNNMHDSQSADTVQQSQDNKSEKDKAQTSSSDKKDGTTNNHNSTQDGSKGIAGSIEDHGAASDIHEANMHQDGDTAQQENLGIDAKSSQENKIHTDSDVHQDGPASDTAKDAQPDSEGRNTGENGNGSSGNGASASPQASTEHSNQQSDGDTRKPDEKPDGAKPASTEHPNQQSNGNTRNPDGKPDGKPAGANSAIQSKPDGTPKPVSSTGGKLNQAKQTAGTVKHAAGDVKTITSKDATAKERGRAVVHGAATAFGGAVGGVHGANVADKVVTRVQAGRGSAHVQRRAPQNIAGGHKTLTPQNASGGFTPKALQNVGQGTPQASVPQTGAPSGTGMGGANMPPIGSAPQAPQTQTPRDVSQPTNDIPSASKRPKELK